MVKKDVLHLIFSRTNSRITREIVNIIIEVLDQTIQHVQTIQNTILGLKERRE